MTGNDDAFTRLDREMSFHLSVKEGLSEGDDAALWSRAAGTARGLLKAQQQITDGMSREEAAVDIRDELDSAMSTWTSGEPLIMSPSDTCETNLTIGFLHGLARAYQIVEHDDGTLAGVYGTAGRNI